MYFKLQNSTCSSTNKKNVRFSKRRKRKKGTHVELWMGISTDEEGRMKPNQINWIENKYPLVEKNMSRQSCIEWFKKITIKHHRGVLVLSVLIKRIKNGKN